MNQLKYASVPFLTAQIQHEQICCNCRGKCMGFKGSMDSPFKETVFEIHVFDELLKSSY